MRYIFAILLVLGIGTTAVADPIEDVIVDQLDAFNARDMDGAFLFASPMIKGIFGTSENFGSMVKRGYPMVWDNDFVRFLDREDAAGSVFQRLLISDADGVPYILKYKMIPSEDGWQIDGVDILPAPQVGA